jgi:hypothetical protein
MSGAAAEGGDGEFMFVFFYLWRYFSNSLSSLHVGFIRCLLGEGERGLSLRRSWQASPLLRPQPAGSAFRWSIPRQLIHGLLFLCRPCALRPPPRPSFRRGADANAKEVSLCYVLFLFCAIFLTPCPLHHN